MHIVERCQVIGLEEEMVFQALTCSVLQEDSWKKKDSISNECEEKYLTSVCPGGSNRGLPGKDTSIMIETIPPLVNCTAAMHVSITPEKHEAAIRDHRRNIEGRRLETRICIPFHPTSND